MKKIAIAAALTFGLALVATPAAADPICTDQVLDPIIHIPVEVCVEVPNLPVPPATPVVPVTPVTPVTPQQPAPSTGGQTTSGSGSDSTSPSPTPSATPVPTPEDKFIDQLAQRGFPWVVLITVLVILFLSTKVYEGLKTARAKSVDKA